jgi:hypothetical protein
MGRIVRSRAGRRTFVGVLAVGALALAACVPLKPEPPPPPVDVPDFEICVPTRDTRAPAARVAAEPGGEPGPCVPLCEFGQVPPPANELAEPAPVPTCVPICLPGQEEPQQPELARVAVPRCVPLLPCLPDNGGGGMSNQSWCTNFCPPGQEQQPPEVSAEFAQRCIPLCRLADLIRPPIPELQCPPAEGPDPTK